MKDNLGWSPVQDTDGACRNITAKVGALGQGYYNTIIQVLDLDFSCIIRNLETLSSQSQMACAGELYATAEQDSTIKPM
jgi:hypothetical protein